MSRAPGFYPHRLPVETEDGHHVVLISDGVFVRLDGSEVKMLAGQESDGLSTPQAGWGILPPFGRAWKAGVLHDLVYRYGDQSKEWCDDLLLEAMHVLNVPRVEALTIYDGVRFGGWRAFREDRKNKEGGIK